MFDLKKYQRVASVKEATQLLMDNPQSRLIAGGTDILIKLRHGKVGFSNLIDIHGLEELRFIKKDEAGNILIGSGVNFTDIIESELLNKEIPMLVDGAQSVGGPQIRNVATVGGNICNGVPSADSAMGLFCLNTLLEIEGSGGMRELPIESFYLGPGKVDLRQGDVLTTFKITPENYRGYRGCYYKYAMRDAMDIATIGCAVSLQVYDNFLADFRISFGVAGPVPIRCPKTEQAMCGQPVSDKLPEQVAGLVAEDVNPRSSWRAARDFRMHIIQELARRATVTALERAMGERE